MIRDEFKRIAPEEAGIRSAAVEQYLNELESGFTEMHGLMIMRHGCICAEGWWQPYGPGLRHGDQSLTKTYAATGIGIAYTEGLLKLEDTILSIFPEYAPEDPSENLKMLTVRDVLCMGCGMDTMPAPTVNWIRDFLAIPVSHVPGTTYMYNSTGSTLLAAIVKKVTGEGLHEYLTPRLFDKIGIDADNLKWMHMPDGTEVGGGGLYSTTEDNLRLMKLYADGGVWNGERILAEDYVRKATSLQNESATEAKGNPEATDNFVGYGFQIWMCKVPGVYRADGAMGQFSIVVPDKDMIISINETAAGAHWAQKTLDVTWEFLKQISDDAALPEDRAAAAHLSDRMRHLSIAAPVFHPSAGISDEISGSTYQIMSGNLQISDQIAAMMSGAPVSKGIRKLSFQFTSSECRISFLMDEKEYQVTAAMDGTRRYNQLKLDHSVLSELYLNAFWKEDHTLALVIRWIETCFEKELDFELAADCMKMDIYDEPKIGGFGIASMARKKAAEAVLKEN